MKRIVVKIGADMDDDLQKLTSAKAIAESPDYTIYFKSARQLSSTLSAQKLTLLQHVSKSFGQPVTKISIELGRKKEAVSRDLHQLESLGFLKMRREGNKVYPKVSYKAIQIEL